MSAIDNYSDRVFLENSRTNSTGYIAAFQGRIDFTDAKTRATQTVHETWLRIADCQQIVQLHVVDDNMRAFIDKLRLVSKVCKDFADHLEAKEDEAEVSGNSYQAWKDALDESIRVTDKP
jgi:hypothetical protein